jgi:hypothetical protein
VDAFFGLRIQKKKRVEEKRRLNFQAFSSFIFSLTLLIENPESKNILPYYESSFALFLFCPLSLALLI